MMVRYLLRPQSFRRLYKLVTSTVEVNAIYRKEFTGPNWFRVFIPWKCIASGFEPGQAAEILVADDRGRELRRQREMKR